MRIAVLGTGMVGRALAGRLAALFVAGDDTGAKEAARGLLRQFGRPDESIIDLGGIEAARGTEMYMQLYFPLSGVLGTFDFNIAVTRA